jgi:hypothetical protein
MPTNGLEECAAFIFRVLDSATLKTETANFYEMFISIDITEYCDLHFVLLIYKKELQENHAGIPHVLELIILLISFEPLTFGTAF